MDLSNNKDNEGLRNQLFCSDKDIPRGGSSESPGPFAKDCYVFGDKLNSCEN